MTDSDLDLELETGSGALTTVTQTRKRGRAHCAPRPRRRSRSADAADVRTRFMGDPELGIASLERMRPATDPGMQYPDGEPETEEGGCFACRYCASKAEGSSDDGAIGWGEADLVDAYSDMEVLMKKHSLSRIASSELVEMVFEFYRREILEHYDYGEWSRLSIYNHIFFHSASEELQLQECTKILYTQVQALRDISWTKDAEGGLLEPNMKTIYLMERMIKSHSDMVKRSRALVR